MAESNEELIKLMKMIRELLDDMPIRNPLTFKQFVSSEKEEEIVSIDWSSRTLMFPDSSGTISLDWGQLSYPNNKEKYEKRKRIIDKLLKDN